MKNQTYRMTMLFDFYGDILTPRQRELFDLYYNEDLSLAEIAENCGISRQGVRDVIVRAENASSMWTPSSPPPITSRPSTTGSTKTPGWTSWPTRFSTAPPL